MKKQNLVAIYMGVPGGMLFSLGMVMGLMSEWDMLIPGVVLGVVGLIILLLIIPIYRKIAGYPKIKLDSKILVPCIIGAIGALILGIGMSLCMVNSDSSKMIMGILIGMLGLLIVIFTPVICISKNGKN